jgi:acyl-CoA dehydrogenase
MGFVEETGAAQPYRDVRITTIYEGTTAIQANDFVGRKIARDRGAALAALLEEVARELAALDATATPDAAAVATARDAARDAVTALETAARSVLEAWAQGPERALAVAVPLLRLTGLVLGGWLLAKSAAIAAKQLAAGATDTDFLRGKIASARFYATHVLPQAQALSRVVAGGAASVLDTDAAVV